MFFLPLTGISTNLTVPAAHNFLTENGWKYAPESCISPMDMI